MSKYTFSQPIRYYKANDPYYYEVDNIPIKQLEENVLSVKSGLEQLQAALGGGGSGGGSGGEDLVEFSLDRIKDLKAKFVSGRQLKVEPGKFTSRINGAYGLNRLLRVNPFLTGDDPFHLINPMYAPWSADERVAVWNSFIQNLTSGGSGYNVNGLENSYTFHPSKGTGMATHLSDGNYTNEGKPKYIEGIDFWPNTKKGFLAGIQNSAAPPNITFSSLNLNSIHLVFVKHWRSAFRTAVVDFPGGNIEVAPFDDYDFFYQDEAGTNHSLAALATHRIDLLFAYAMPIDASSTTLSDYEESYCTNGDALPKTISKPMLGIVRGAGVGIKKVTYANTFDIDIVDECSDNVPDAGDQRRILGNVHDADVNSNYGILTDKGVRIHGSFPSPDDLMNQAMFPAGGVATAGDNMNLQLIGQTVLPIAYIVVKKDQISLDIDDIIDIRPFLRTTELTYNERAGVAAANPPLSFANPAVGAYQVKDAITAAISTLDGGGTEPNLGESGKAIYTDYIMGGLAFGVEGTILTMSDPVHGQNPNNYTWTDIAGVTYKGYSFSEFSNPKAFMESTDLNKKKAMLEYLHTTKQPSLKRLMSSFDNFAGNENPAYLGLDDNRDIPLYPEWDLAIDNINNPNAFLQSTPEFSWWMAMEGVSKARPYAFAPGGIASTRTAASTADLGKEFIHKNNNDDTLGSYFLQLNTKTFRISLPSWCVDYDILVEYTNCAPLIHSRENLAPVGLSVEKAKVFSIAGSKFSFFNINSSARSKSDVGLDVGNIKDSNTDIAGNYDNWLTYAVHSGFRRNGAWGTGTQNQGAAGDITNRTLPKLGGSFYPTVKFTIIAYPTPIYSRNKTLTDIGSNKTYVPNSATNGGSSSVIVPQSGNTQIIYPPVPSAQNRLSLLDLTDVDL